MNERVDPAVTIGSRRSRSYMLRVWQEELESPWRAMLRDVITKQEHVFRNLEDMAAFLNTGAGQTIPTDNG